MTLSTLPTPTLETPRLRLRAHTVADFPARYAIWSDPEIVRYITGTPLTEAEAWARMLLLVGHWQLVGYGYWAVEEKSTGRFVGEIGFGNFKRPIEPSIRGVPELGWVIAREAQGKGYATEGVRAALEWGDRHFGEKETVCLIDPENLASQRVAEKNRYRETARTTLLGKPTILFRRDRR